MIRMKLDRIEPYLYQWDTQQRITILKLEEVLGVYCCVEGDKEALYVGVCSSEIPTFFVPNVLLQRNGTLIVYLVRQKKGQDTTVYKQTFQIKQKAKPDDWIYTEEDRINWSSLDKRVSNLENSNPILTVNGQKPDEKGNIEITSTGLLTDDTLIMRDGVLSVNTTTEVKEDNTLPVTSAAVATTVGNIEILLQSI